MRKDFSRARAEEVLVRLSALRLPNAEKQSRERIEAAIVLLAAGDASRFEHAASEAEIDWRDPLVATGLADDDWPTRLDEELGPV